MSILASIGSIGAVSKVLLKILGLIDPKTRDWVNKRKALEWGEKYILKDTELKQYMRLRLDLTKKEKSIVNSLKKKLGYYKKWFFQYN